MQHNTLIPAPEIEFRHIGGSTDLLLEAFMTNQRTEIIITSYNEISNKFIATIVPMET